MRRRASDYRRPVRRRFSYFIWVLVLFLIGGLALFVLQHYHEDHMEQQNAMDSRKHNMFTLVTCPTIFVVVVNGIQDRQ
ncbi:hypothetical protein Leryth_021057 [Lithospermum erythrorhizon]|nr:hypothetical protein Leryth_021057 [Lithospermum erythrorhizon]